MSRSGRRAPSQSSQATVTTIHSETPEFDLRIARMGELVDPCDAEMLMLTQCLNEAGGRKDEVGPKQESDPEKK